MRFNWQDKTVIITGSGMGIGWHLAKELSQAGAKVVLNARNKFRLDKRERELAEKGYVVTSFSGDISNPDTCNAMVEHCIATFGSLDILINNAGISAEAATIEEIDPAVFTQIMKVNFFGAVYCTQAALPYIKQKKGYVLFVSSLAGIHGLENYAAYCSSKMALTSFSESLRKELCKADVAVGIAYVSFTENDADKQIITRNGSTAPQPMQTHLRVALVENVVKKMKSMIESRRRTVLFSSMGVFLYIVNRLSPVLTHKLLLLLYRKRKKQTINP